MIEARNISFSINSKKLLADVSLNIRNGEVLAVLGANGAGKSTLRKILGGDLLPSSGEVLMTGKPLSNWTLLERARVRAVLPQHSTLDFPFSVAEVVLLGRAPHLQGTESKRDFAIAEATLEAVEAAHLRERIYPTLSGGEQQRVHLARTLAQIWEAAAGQPRYLLLDEPTSNLDLAHQHSILKIVKKFAREGVGAMVILHDLNLAAQYADKIVLLKNGKIVAHGKPAEVLTPEIIEETLAMPVIVMRHPKYDCPLIVV